MPAHQIRQRLLPYKILGYLLYASKPWLESAEPGVVRVTTGPASRELRMRVSNVWEALYWLEDQGLIQTVLKERKRGTALVLLVQPPNMAGNIDG